MVCDGVCSDLQTDNDNCGGCGTVCGTGEACVAGQCLQDCGQGMVACDGTCIDPNTDSNYCGASGDCADGNAGEVCAGDLQCISGGCGCEFGVYCGGACIDPDTDTGYCGAQGDCQGENAGSVCGGNEDCVNGTCERGDDCVGGNHVCLTGQPDPSNVFNNIEQTYFFSNDLTNAIWHGPSNTIINGHFNRGGYWQFGVGTCGYGSTPTFDTGLIYGRMIQMPAQNTVLHTSGYGAARFSEMYVARIDGAGQLGPFERLSPSDGFMETCNLLSSSWDQLLCYDGSAIHHYGIENGSTTATFEYSLQLTPAPAEPATDPCWGGTFAFDGMYYYFPLDCNMDNQPERITTYQVYDRDGNHLNDFDAAGMGGVTSLYFDWSVGRYSVHDGYGIFQGGDLFNSNCGGTPDNDSQTYSPPSPFHSY